MRTLSRLSSLLLLLAAIPATATAVLADDTDAAAIAPFKPKEYDASRYARNFERKSPFEFDPPVVPDIPVEDYFKDVSLGGYCGAGNTLSVHLIVGKEKKRLTVYGDGSPFKKRDTSGFRILSIQRGKSLTTTTVLLEKNGQQKAVAFDRDTLTAKGSGGGAGAGLGKNHPAKIMVGPDGRALPQNAGAGPAPVPVQPYQAPPPFIPGQSNQAATNASQNGPNLQAMQLQQQQQLAERQAALKARLAEQEAANTIRTTRRVVLPTSGQ